MACNKIRIQSLPKWKKQWQTLSCQFVLNQLSVFPEHCAFCLCEAFDALPNVRVKYRRKIKIETGNTYSIIC